MPPRTILYMTPSVRLLGARQSLLALVRALDPARFRPLVCCQSEGDLTEALTRAGIEWTLLKTGWWRKARYWPRIPWALWRLSRLVRKTGAALIHCNEIYPVPFAVRSGWWRGVPVVAHARFSMTPRMARMYGLLRCARVIAVSQDAARDFDHWPDKVTRVAVIHNAVDSSWFEGGMSQLDARRSMGLPETGFLAGLVATWAPRKRQHVAIEAARLLADRAPGFRLVLAGGAAERQRGYEKELRLLIEEYGLEGRVTLLPFTKEVATLYRALNLNLLISGEEVFGRTIIEAGAAGLPTIGARTGGIPELIRDGETGWLVPPDDAPALAERIARLGAEPETIQRAGDAARRDVRERFSIEDHARRVMALYDEVIRA